MPQEIQSAELIGLTATIVAAHVSKNAISATELPGLIATVHKTLATVGTEEAAARPDPAVPIKKSIRPETIICLEDGTKHKMLKRHLRTAHDMTPDEYRNRWGLPRDYPLVAPNYAATRSRLAKKIGLGTRRGSKTKKKARSAR